VALRQVAATLQSADPVRGLRINVEPTKTLRELASGDGFQPGAGRAPTWLSRFTAAQDTAGLGHEVRRAYGAA